MREWAADAGVGAGAERATARVFMREPNAGALKRVCRRDPTSAGGVPAPKPVASVVFVDVLVRVRRLAIALALLAIRELDLLALELLVRNLRQEVPD